MAIFIDSANVGEVRELVSWGIIAGATTNPKIMSLEKPGYNFRDRILEIVDIVKGPVSVEVTAEDKKGMIEQGKEYAGWNKKYIVIKVPMSEEGLKVISVLERDYGIKTNATVMMNFNQAYFACLAGASFVSIFSGRIRDMGYDARTVIKNTREMIDREKLKAKIIVGSIRHLMDVNEAFLAGAHIVTVTPQILKKMTWNPQTVSTINEFNAIWKNLREKELIK